MDRVPGLDEAGAVDLTQAVSRIPFLRCLEPADLERLRPFIMGRRVAQGQRIWTQGDSSDAFTFLAEGRVKLVKSTDTGRDVIVDVCVSGELLCGSAICGSGPYCCTATGLAHEVDLVVVPRRDVLALLDISPAASRAFLREVTVRTMGLTERISQLSSGQVDRRIAALFLRLVDQLGSSREDGGIWVPVTLTRQDLADLCGTSLETVIRVMTRLARRGVLRTVGRGFVAPDRNRLDAVMRGAFEES